MKRSDGLSEIALDEDAVTKRVLSYDEAVDLMAGRVRRPEILDACCGGRHWWWDKAHPLAVYMDKREAPRGSLAPYRPNWNCTPDLLGDFRAMPFEDETFQLVVFDPPHIIKTSGIPTGLTGMKYGTLERATASSDLAHGLGECWRVLRRGGSLVFKWAGSLDLVEPHFPAEPIVGTRTRAETRWLIFYKPLEQQEAHLAA